MRGFDEAEMRRVFTSLGWKKEDIEVMVAGYAEIYKHEKDGDNVLHLNFSGEIFSEEEIIELENEFRVAGLEFSFVDENKVPKASAIEIIVKGYLIINELVLTQPLGLLMVTKVAELIYNKLKGLKGNKGVTIYYRKDFEKRGKTKKKTEEFIISGEMDSKLFRESISRFLEKGNKK